MKILTQFLLFFLLVAFAAPSVIDILDFDEEICFKITDENEKSKEEKELKLEFIISDSKLQFAINQFVSTSVSNEYLLKEYTVFTSINILPPKV
jgi:short subunit fatty acids transporter